MSRPHFQRSPTRGLASCIALETAEMNGRSDDAGSRSVRSMSVARSPRMKHLYSGYGPEIRREKTRWMPRDPDAPYITIAGSLMADRPPLSRLSAEAGAPEHDVPRQGGKGRRSGCPGCGEVDPRHERDDGTGSHIDRGQVERPRARAGGDEDM